MCPTIGTSPGTSSSKTLSGAPRKAFLVDSRKHVVDEPPSFLCGHPEIHCAHPESNCMDHATAFIFLFLFSFWYHSYFGSIVIKPMESFKKSYRDTSGSHSALKMACGLHNGFSQIGNIGLIELSRPP